MKIKGFYRSLFIFPFVACCLSCSPKSQEQSSKGHVHNFTYVTFLDSTCTKEGVKAHYYCAKCDKKYLDKDGKEEILDVSIAKKSHDYQFVSSTPSSCCDAGYSTYKCKNCNKEHYDDFTSCTNHSFDESKTEHFEATCLEPGYDLCFCTKCEKKISCNFTKTLGHHESTIILPTIHKPTCVDEGYTVHHCDRCDKDYITDVVSKLGHDFDISTIEETESTCELVGYTKISCSRCDEKLIEYKEQHSHNFVGEECSLCHKTYDETTLIKAYDRDNYDNYSPVPVHKDSKWDYIIDFESDSSADKNGSHYCMIELDLNVLNELKNNGIGSLIFTPGSPDDNVRAFAIEQDGDFIAVNVGGNEFASMSFEKPFLDSEGNILNVYKKSGMKFLLIHGRTIEYSGVLKSFALKMEFSCLTHSQIESTKYHKDATCTEEGYDQYECSECGLTYKTNIVPALNHDYKVTEHYDEPTCEHFSGTISECTKCHDVKKEIIEDKIDHVFEDGECKFCHKELEEIDCIKAYTNDGRAIDVNKNDNCYDVRAPLSNEDKTFVVVRKNVLEEAVKRGNAYLTLTISAYGYDGRTFFLFENPDDPIEKSIAQGNIYGGGYASKPLSVTYKLIDENGKLDSKYENGLSLPVLAIGLNTLETKGFTVDLLLTTTNQVIAASNLTNIVYNDDSLSCSTKNAGYCYFAIDPATYLGKTTLTISINGSCSFQPVSPIDVSNIGKAIVGNGSYSINISDYLINGFLYFGMYYNGTNTFSVSLMAE